MKKILAVLVVALLTAGIVALADAQEKKAAAAKAPAVTAAPRAAGAAAPTAPRRPNFAVIFGNITKIDNADPAKPKLEVKSDIDGTTHTVDITPWTNVTKVTDLSELKTGDTVRIMARKVDNNELAMTVVFGKIKNMYAPRAPLTKTQPAAATAPAAAKK